MLLRNPFKLIRFPFKYNKTQFFSTTNNSNQDNSSQSGPVSPNPEINKILKELSSDLNSKVPFIHKFNYNFEENKKYTKNVKKALVSAAEKAKLQSQNVVPRRKRKVYDRPLHDLNLEKYSAWRVFEKSQPKFADDIHNLATKLVVSPALFVKVFGKGSTPNRVTRATREYDFEDNDLSRYLVYDYPLQGPRKAHIKKPLPEEEFWNSDEKHIFRVECTRYADFRKFKKWIYEELEKKKDQPSFDEVFLQKYGDIEKFEDYDKKYELNTEATYLKYDWSYYLQKGEKLEENTDFPYTYIPAKVLDEKYRLKYPEDVKNLRTREDKSAPKKTEEKEEGKQKEEEKDKKNKKGDKKEKKGEENKGETKEKGKKGKAPQKNNEKTKEKNVENEEKKGKKESSNKENVVNEKEKIKKEGDEEDE